MHKEMKTTLKIGAVAGFLVLASVASAQAAPGLVVSVSAPSSVQATAGQTIANITLSAPNGAILNSLPVVIGYSNSLPGNTGPANPLSNCTLRNSNNAVLSAGNPTGTIGAGQVGISFASPLVIGPNSAVTLALNCDITPAVPNNSGLAVMVPTANVSAASSSIQLVVSGTGGAGATATPMATTLVTSATPGGTPTTPPAPGVPNTGAGGSAGINFAILALSLLTAVGSGLYLSRLLKA
ncbi:MAG: hypothetical protein KGI70_01525 [Patescibacteria group bacterium]|nr:hypothetical protein [Patescibacteria group bacterium]